MKTIMTLGLAALLTSGTAAHAAAPKGHGPWSATASHQANVISTPTVATVVGNGPGDGTFTGSGPHEAKLESRATVSASSADGSAKASAEDWSIHLLNHRGDLPTTDSGSFLDTLTNFQSKTGIVSGHYVAEFKESTGELDSHVIGGGLNINIFIDYANFADETYDDRINFETSDCIYVPDVCKATRTFSLKEIPQAITVSMWMGTRQPGGPNQAPHEYSAKLGLAFAELLPCAGHSVDLCATPVPFDAAAHVAVPEPASWVLAILGFAAVGSALRRCRRDLQAA